MSKSKDRKNVKQMTIAEIETELKNAGGTRKSVLVNELNSRNK